MSSRGIALGLALLGGLFAIACVAAPASKADEGYLGVFLEPVPPVLAIHLGLAEGTGVVAMDVAAESAADKAGIGQYDVIVSMNGKEVKGMDLFSAAVRQAGAAHKITLGIISKGQKKEVEVTLGAMSDAKGTSKDMSTKGGRRLLKDDDQRPGFGPKFRFAPGTGPLPLNPDDNAPLIAPEDERIQMLEDRIAEIEKRQTEILDKLDKLLAK